jgi:hypothetical protein
MCTGNCIVCSRQGWSLRLTHIARAVVLQFVPPNLDHYFWVYRLVVANFFLGPDGIVLKSQWAGQTREKKFVLKNVCIQFFAHTECNLYIYTKMYESNDNQNMWCPQGVEN